MGRFNWKEALQRVKKTTEYKLEILSASITHRILKIMDKNSINRSDLADKLGVSKPVVSKFLNQGSNITIKRLLLIADALDSDIEVKIVPRQSQTEYSSVNYNVVAFKRIRPGKACGEIKQYDLTEYANAS